MTEIDLTDSSRSQFSWRRVGGLMKYFSILMRQQLTVYLCVSLIFAILLLLPLGDLGKLGSYVLVWWLIPLMAQLAPCALGKRGYTGTIERLMPVKPSEKMGFYLLYFLVIVPACCYVLPYLAEMLCIWIPALNNEVITELVKIQFGMTCPLYLLNALASIATILTCLYVVNRARHNKVLFGIVAVILCKLCAGIFGAIVGGLTASYFRAGVYDGFNNLPVGTSIEEDNGFMVVHVSDLLERLSGVIWIGIGIMTAYVIFILILNYRYLRESNH